MSLKKIQILKSCPYSQQKAFIIDLLQKKKDINFKKESKNTDVENILQFLKLRNQGGKLRPALNFVRKERSKYDVTSLKVSPRKKRILKPSMNSNSYTVVDGWEVCNKIDYEMPKEYKSNLQESKQIYISEEKLFLEIEKDFRKYNPNSISKINYNIHFNSELNKALSFFQDPNLKSRHDKIRQIVKLNKIKHKNQKQVQLDKQTHLYEIFKPLSADFSNLKILTENVESLSSEQGGLFPKLWERLKFQNDIQANLQDDQNKLKSYVQLESAIEYDLFTPKNKEINTYSQQQEVLQKRILKKISTQIECDSFNDKLNKYIQNNIKISHQKNDLQDIDDKNIQALQFSIQNNKKCENNSKFWNQKNVNTTTSSSKTNKNWFFN